MGAKASKNSNSKREPKSLSSNVTTSHQRPSIIESMKPKCLKKGKTTKKKKPKKMTLGNWLLASPDRKCSHPNSLNGGELYMFEHFSKRVQQSSLNLCSGDDVSGSSFSWRNPSGKLKKKKKKKVKFMLPEEGDIVVFYSAEETFESE